MGHATPALLRLFAVSLTFASCTAATAGASRTPGTAPPQGTASPPPAQAQAQPPAQAAPAPANLPRVYLFATGGTISNRTGGRLTVDELIKSVPNLDRRVRAEGEQFLNVSSGAITMEQWLDLSRRINTKFKSDADLAGVVVTSGTDTLEELAYFLALCNG